MTSVVVQELDAWPEVDASSRLPLNSDVLCVETLRRSTDLRCVFCSGVNDVLGGRQVRFLANCRRHCCGLRRGIQALAAPCSDSQVGRVCVQGLIGLLSDGVLLLPHWFSLYNGGVAGADCSQAAD